MKNIINFPKMNKVEYFENNSFLFQWCCSCGLRHIWHFEIVKIGKKEYIKISGTDDPLATKLRKFYKAHKR